MNKFKKHILTIAGISVGAISGYLYYRYIGCSGGMCPITSQPLNSTLYGAMMGGLLFNMFEKEESKKIINTKIENGKSETNNH